MTNSSESPFPFELVTWYDTWNENALKKLQEERGGVPLHYATRYNLAFGQLVPQAGGAYSIEMGNFAAQVKALIHKKRPNAQIWASTGPDGGVEDAVMDNREHGNRSTTAIVTWLKDNGYHGLVIDEENNTSQVPEFVTQLGPSFKKANLGIIVSAMWPDLGPTGVFGDQAVKAFHQHVAAIELQDYSPSSAPPGKGTEAHALQWIKAGIPAGGDLLGGEYARKEANFRPH